MLLNTEAWGLNTASVFVCEMSELKISVQVERRGGDRLTDSCGADGRNVLYCIIEYMNA